MANRTREIDAQLLPLIAQGATNKQAAERCGIAERTVSRRLADPVFQAKAEELRSRLYEAAVARLTAGAAGAAGTLLDLLTRPSDSETGYPPAIRLGAARAVLEFAHATRDTESLLRRVDELAGQVAELKAAKGGSGGGLKIKSGS